METKKKVWKSFFVDVELPEGVSAEFNNYLLKIVGPKGEVSKLMKFPHVEIILDGNKVSIGTKRFTQRQKKIIFTYRAHLNNMVKGVTEGFNYSLKVLYSKFPITVELKGNVFSVKNFLGEKVPRIIEIPSDVKVEVKGADISVSGIDKERCGQVAALLEQTTRINHLDRRVVQDGIYIVEKPHRKYA